VIEGRKGIFSWCVVSWFYFPWNVNLGNYSLWLVTWRFCVTREEPELLTGIRNFTTLFYVIFKRKFPEWLEPSIESDLGMWFAIWSLALAIRDFTFFKHCFLCKNRSLKKSVLLAYFRDSGKRQFYIRDPFVNRSRGTPPPRPVRPPMIKHSGHLRTIEKCGKHPPAAGVFYISLRLLKFPTCFITV